MDLGFFRRGLDNMAVRSTARIDYDLLLATLHASQAQSATARAHARQTNGSGGGVVTAAPLVEILSGGPHWRTAVEEQRGSFNAAFAAKASSNA